MNLHKTDSEVRCVRNIHEYNYQYSGPMLLTFGKHFNTKWRTVFIKSCKIMKIMYFSSHKARNKGSLVLFLFLSSAIDLQIGPSVLFFPSHKASNRDNLVHFLFLSSLAEPGCNEDQDQIFIVVWKKQIGDESPRPNSKSSKFTKEKLLIYR